MKAQKAISMIAAENGVTVKEVREEIQKAIDEGMKSTDPKAMELWKNCPKKGDKPTPEELIEYISEIVKKDSRFVSSKKKNSTPLN
ncbi:MAG: hypothetical protein K2H90_00755 [Oscillospiraceae bacterium]|nr:hypothetical protein [Oscillospiraceae bacterium]